MEPLPLVPATCRMSGGGREEEEDKDDDEDDGDDDDGVSFKSRPSRRR